jgi:hypothetical protein
MVPDQATPRGPDVTPDVTALRAAAADAGLAVLSSASWPETSADTDVPALAGFIESSFSPLLAEVATRALRRRPDGAAAAAATAIVIVTAFGDTASAAHVAAAIDAGRRVSPLLFFQSVPNAVAGHLAARWNLTGPVACVSGIRAGLGIAALFLADADADEALIVHVDLPAGGGLGAGAALLATQRTGTIPDPHEPPPGGSDEDPRY